MNQTPPRRPMPPQNRPLSSQRGAMPPARPQTRPPSTPPPGQRPGRVPPRPAHSRPAAAAPQPARPPLSRPAPSGGTQQKRPMSREELQRRRAYLAYLERKKAEKRRRILYLILASLICLFLIGIIVILVRLFDARETTPVSATTSAPPVSTTAPLVTTEPPSDTTAPEIKKETPVILRPKIDASTVVLTEEISSTHAALIDPENGRVLAEKQGTERMYPASMTKIMTLLVAYEHISDLDAAFTVTSTIIDPLYRAEASLAGFAPGETVTVRDLMYGTILPSGAEAAVSLAIHVAGSEEAFVTMMNEKANELGLVDTHFTNCSGLHHKDHYSTAVEIGMILDYTMQYEECRTILSTYRYTTSVTEKHPEGIPLESTMFSRMYGDEPNGVTVKAGKTGYTHQAHQCLASYAEDDLSGKSYIFVSSGASGKFEPVFDAIRVYSDYTGQPPAGTLPLTPHE